MRGRGTTSAAATDATSTVCLVSPKTMLCLTLNAVKTAASLAADSSTHLIVKEELQTLQQPHANKKFDKKKRLLDAPACKKGALEVFKLLFCKFHVLEGKGG